MLIKQFVGWESDTLVLHQLNPTDTLRDPARTRCANATSSSAPTRKANQRARPSV